MGGVDTYRGIAYQHAQAVLSALDVVESDVYTAIRVEGEDDVIDIELLGADGRVALGKQAKVRAEGYAWAKADLIRLLRRWAALETPEDATFHFLTDGRLGPSGEEVRHALSEAAADRRTSLADLLGEEPDGATVRKVARAAFVLDPGGTGALLTRAERQVMALLPAARSRADAEELARSAVDALFRLLLDRACRPESADRVVSRGEICRALGIPASTAVALAWRGDVRDQYLAAMTAEPPLSAIPARLKPEGSLISSSGGVEALLADEALSMVVAGPTGSGKSTAARELRAVAAAQGRVVIVTHAETYIPGRVDALVADAVADVVGREVPTLTGRQVLADADAFVVIDGVSEVPESVRTALAEDLRVPVATGRGTNLVLLGRDLALARSVLPASSLPSLFRVEPFAHLRRRELAERVLGSGTDQHWVSLRVVEETLGDAAGNPMLLKMALELVMSGVTFDDRSAVYGAFLDHLGERSGVSGLGIASVLLGVCFAQLLDRGRRYADPYTWRRLLVEAVETQSALIGPVDVAEIDGAARRSGLIVHLGQSQTVVAVHDSFADYLAGLALARGAVPFPAEVAAGDEERLVFAAQIGEMDQAFAETVAARLPFALPRFAPLDRRRVGDGAPAEVSAMLRHLLPVGASAGTDLWRLPDGRVVAVSRAEKGAWLMDEEARTAMASRPWAVSTGGPIDLVVRLWRQWLLAGLPSSVGAGRARPTSAEEARDAVAAHAAEVAAETNRLIHAVVPAAHRAVVAAEIGPMGLTGHVIPTGDDTRCGGSEWVVEYTRTEDIDISVSGVPHVAGNYPSRGTFDSMVGRLSVNQAGEWIKKAIDRMAGGQWL